MNVAVSVACASPWPAAGRVTAPWAVTTAGLLVLHVMPGTDGQREVPRHRAGVAQIDRGLQLGQVARRRRVRQRLHLARRQLLRVDPEVLDPAAELLPGRVAERPMKLVAEVMSEGLSVSAVLEATSAPSS